MVKKAMKVWRLQYWKTLGDSPFISLTEGPNEVKIAVSKKNFISVREDGISLSAGNGNLNIQAMPSKMSFAGMISPPPFPLNLIPSTLATPIPSMIITPPFSDILPTVREMSRVALSLVTPA